MIYKQALWEGIKEKQEKRKKIFVDAEDWTQDPLQNIRNIHGLNRTAMELFY